MEPLMIGKKISTARKKINISQAQLAERLFISPQAVGKWERGESVPDILTMNRLAEILGVDLNYFSERFISDVSEDSIEASRKRSGESDRDGMTSGKQEMPAKEARKNSWDMSRENLVDGDFSGLKNLHEKFSSSNMQRCLFIGSEMSGLLLNNNNIDGCDFSRSDMSSSHIRNSNLANNIFKGCSLKETEFSGSFLGGCDFSGADLTGAQFRSGGLGDSTFTNVVWNRTSFIDMRIAGIVFDGTLDDCHFENCVFTRVTFQGSTLRNTFFKNCRRLKQVRFSDCKMDKLTYAFLKNGKADLTGITLLPA